MSAINEWFGSYSAVFRYIERTYGKEELERYLDYLATVANDDVVRLYRQGGLDAIESRLAGNFRLDGGDDAVRCERTADHLTLEVRCPAFHNKPVQRHPDLQIDSGFCRCCIRYNTRILQEAGFALEVSVTGNGHCCWKIRLKESE